MAQRRSSTERKKILSTVKQNGGGCSAPPPRTSGDSSGGRTPPNRGGLASQSSDVSEGKKKRERLGTVAEVVWCSEASRGSFYRRGRGRELGFRKGVWREKSRGAAALATSLGHGGRSWVTRLLRGQAGVAR
jgi:hypothetical protein